MDGLIFKYEWLSHDFIYLKKGFRDSCHKTQPMLFDSNKLTIKYREPEGGSSYASYIGQVDGVEFEFASLNLDLADKDDADEAVNLFFIERPKEE